MQNRKFRYHSHQQTYISQLKDVTRLEGSSTVFSLLLNTFQDKQESKDEDQCDGWITVKLCPFSVDSSEQLMDTDSKE